MRSGDPPGYTGEAVEPFDHADQSSFGWNTLPCRRLGPVLANPEKVLTNIPQHLAAVGELAIEQRSHHDGAAHGEQALQNVDPIGVGPDQNAGLILQNSLHYFLGRFLRRGAGQFRKSFFPFRQHLRARRRGCGGSGVFGYARENAAGMNAGQRYARAVQLPA
jgi:hypothetical protein